MGEISEMMQEGILCCQCGEALPEAAGYLTLCRNCRTVSGCKAAIKKPKGKILCLLCGKPVSKIGLTQHIRDYHHLADGRDPIKDLTAIIKSVYDNISKPDLEKLAMEIAEKWNLETEG